MTVPAFRKRYDLAHPDVREDRSGNVIEGVDCEPHDDSEARFAGDISVPLHQPNINAEG